MLNQCAGRLIERTILGSIMVLGGAWWGYSLVPKHRFSHVIWYEDFSSGKLDLVNDFNREVSFGGFGATSLEWNTDFDNNSCMASLSRTNDSCRESSTAHTTAHDAALLQYGWYQGQSDRRRSLHSRIHRVRLCCNKRREAWLVLQRSHVCTFDHEREAHDAIWTTRNQSQDAVR